MSTRISIPEDILSQARAWYVRLGSEQAGVNDWQEFTSWLEADLRHLDAYDQVELAVADIPTVAFGTPVTSSPLADNVVSLQDKRRVLKSVNLTHLMGIAATLIAALALLYTTNVFQSSPAQAQQYATNIGEYKDITLADGTRINLNTNTSLSVTMSKRSRTVTLHKGEVHFDIADDKNRSFVVNASDTKITDIGTAFSVYFADRALSVSVVEGIVDIQSPKEKIRLTKGQKAVRAHKTEAILVANVDISNISTWRDGVLVFENTPLSGIVPELNRYFETPIILADARTAALTFSGVLNISDQDKMIGSIEALLPVSVKRDNKQIFLSGKN